VFRRSPTTAPRWLRRGRRLAVFGVLVGAVAGLRTLVLQRDQQAFDARYGPGRDPE
jgi:hypothetical protein